MKVRRLSAAIATSLVLCLLGAGAASAQSAVKITAPAAVQAPQEAAYSVWVPAGASKVSLSVDGEQRWTVFPADKPLTKRGHISTVDLSAGNHVVKVSANIGKHVAVATKAFRMKPKHGSTPSRGKTGGSTTTSSGSGTVSGATGSGGTTGSGSTSSGSTTTTESSTTTSGGSTTTSTETSSGSSETTTKTETTETTTETKTPVTPPVETPVETTPPVAKNVFASGFDGSFSGWHLQSLAGRATINTKAPFAGTGSARFEVRPGDVEPETGSNRSEVSGPTFNSGEEFFVRDEIRVPAGYSYQGPWQLIQQLHDANWSGSPATATFLDANRNITYASGNSRTIYWRGPQLELERWYTFVYHIKLSPNASEGFVEIWLNGVQQKLQNGSTRMYGATIQTSQCYLKAGIYRDPTSTGISLIEHDDIVVGPSLASVMSY